MRKIRNTVVCVTGGAGFLGSHLVGHLIEDRNCEVVILDNLCAGRKEFIHPEAKFIHCDITMSETFLKKVFESHKVQFVFSYAAHPYIPDSFERPLHIFEVNANGAIKVINAAQEAGCQGILQVSSAEIYGDAGAEDSTIGILGDGKIHHIREFKIDEHCRVRPHSTYGTAKAAVDFYCQSAWKERQTPVISMRQFNCVGERDSLHPYIIPEIIKQVKNLREQRDTGKPKTVFLGNNSFRDFQYAGDAVKMATELLEKGQFGEVYNMGSEGGIRIYDLAILIGKLMGVDVEVQQDPKRVRPWEIWHLLSDNSKLYSVIESRPTTSLEKMLTKTIDYFATNGWDLP